MEATPPLEPHAPPDAPASELHESELHESELHESELHESELHEPELHEPVLQARIEPRRLHPASPIVDLFVWLPRMWPVLLLAVSRSWGPLLVVLVVAVVLAVRFVAWWRTSYAFDGHELTVTRGVWNRTVQRVPVIRVQQVEVVRKLRHQAIGVTMLRVQLADNGLSNGDVVLDVLSQHDADVLKAGLEQNRRATTLGPQVAAAIPPPPAHELLRLTPRVLAIGGVTGASLLVVPAGFFALLSALDDIGLDDDAEEVALRVPIVGIVVFAAVLAPLVAAAIAVARNHGFRLERHANDLVIEKGLLERRVTTVPLARVQVVRVHRNILRRWCGLASVDVSTSGKATAEGAGSADDSVPVARWDDALAVASVAMGDRVLVTADRAAVPAAVRRLVRRWIVIAVVLFSWTPFVHGPVALAVPVVAAVIAGLVARASGRARRHGVGVDVVVVERGVLGWSRRLVPIDRVQSWGTTQSPFQRRHGLRHVSIHLSGTRSVNVADASDAQAAAIVEAIASREAMEIAR